MPEQKWTQTNWTEAMRDACRKALTAVGIHLTGAAMTYASGNVQTGRLAGSLTWAVQGFQSKVTYPTPKKPGPRATQADAVDKPTDQWTLYVGTNVEYAPHVEYGTVKSKDYPYLRPALDNNRKEAQQIFAAQIQKAIRVHGK